MVNHPNRGRAAREERLRQITESLMREGRRDDPNLRTAVHAIDRYQNDARFRALAQHACFIGLEALPKERDEFDRRDVYRALTEACAFLLEGILSGDAELNAMREERDRYKQFAEESAGLRPMAPIIIKAPAPPSEGE